VWRVKDEDVCHLEHLDPEIQPSRFLLAVASMEMNNVTVDTANIDTKYVHAVDDGEWEGDRDTLTQDMNLLCEGRDIRKVKKTFVTEQQFSDLINDEKQEDTVRQLRGHNRAHCCMQLAFALAAHMARARSSDDESSPEIDPSIFHQVVVSDSMM